MINLAVIIRDPEYRIRIEDYFAEHREVEVQAFENGESILLRSDLNIPDVILFDIDSNTEHSFVILRSISSKYESSSILVYASNKESAIVFEALTSGARGYLLKKEPLSFIRDCVRACYDGDAPMSPEIARVITGFFNRRNKTQRDPKMEKRMALLRLLAEREEK